MIERKCNYCGKESATHTEGTSSVPTCDSCCIQGKSPKENRKLWESIQKKSGVINPFKTR